MLGPATRSPLVSPEAPHGGWQGGGAVVRWFLSWGPVVLWTLVTFFLSTQPHTAYFVGLEAPSYRQFQRYVQYPAHFFEYTFLALLWLRAILRRPLPRPAAEWIAVLAVVLTGLVDETIQSFIPTRSFTLRDLVMDGAGALFAVLLSRWVFPLRTTPCT